MSRVSEQLRAAKTLEEHIQQGAKRRIPAPERAPKVPKPSKPFLRPRFHVRDEGVLVEGCPIHGKGTHPVHQCEVIRDQAVLFQHRRRDGDLTLPWFKPSEEA
ncbi:hypothetical protein GPECTOR_147g12 [Gonium pectorale]|uniref:Uncharacterized protein n=1 Tax=Gonium pectorale TaxID=33097 RepID=A0A150FXW2_GONPE|nr:hypothetical protein GPECTOR_147g12 [Gonium pectorale]|eukprot:KXZ42428.1 hypothetical protein GPECTOR_147g12 [Gonium pectorale]